MLEEIQTKQEEEVLLQKVRSKKRVRGLLIFINVLLASYFVFELTMKIIDYASSSPEQTEIISLNGNSKTKSLEIYDKYLAKDDEGKYIVSEAYDFGIYGGYLSLSSSKITEGDYYSFDYGALVNVSSGDIYRPNKTIDGNYLNGGINLNELSNGDYLVFNDYITMDNLEHKHKGIKIRSEVGIEKAIYTLPDSNNVRRKVTIKSKDSSPCLVISVNEVNSLPSDYYDYVIFANKEEGKTFVENNNLSSYKTFITDSLLDAFKANSNYCILLAEEEKMIVSSYVNVNSEMNNSVIKLNDASIIEEKRNDYNKYFKELGGYLTFSGQCIEDEPSSFITKPYLKGYDVGKFVIITNKNNTLENISKLF